MKPTSPQGWGYPKAMQWRIQGRGPGPPLIFRPKWGPNGRKNFFGDRPPPLSQDLDDPPPPPSEGLDLPMQWVQSGAHQMEPPSPLISWVIPFPSRFMNRTACFPRKVSYFRESRMSPWEKWSWMKSNSEAHPSTVFLFTIRPFLWFYSRWDLGIMK